MMRLPQAAAAGDAPRQSAGDRHGAAAARRARQVVLRAARAAGRDRRAHDDADAHGDGRARRRAQRVRADDRGSIAWLSATTTRSAWTSSRPASTARWRAAYREIQDITFPVVVKATDAARRAPRGRRTPRPTTATSAARRSTRRRSSRPSRSRRHAGGGCARPQGSRTRRSPPSTSSSSTSSPPARRASPSTATRVWAR